MRRSPAATGSQSWAELRARAPGPDPLTKIRDREERRRRGRGGQTGTAASDIARVDRGVGPNARRGGVPGPDRAPSLAPPAMGSRDPVYLPPTPNKGAALRA